MQDHTLLFWVLFNVFVLLSLAVDLGVLHRNARVMQTREALAHSAVWIALAAAFAAALYFWKGRSTALEFSTGYLVEQSLSVDNLFVFLLIFRYFRIPPIYQHKVLFWGVLGAIVMRGLFILAGIALIQRLHWIAYVMGAFLIFLGSKLAFARGPEVHPEKNALLRLARRIFPVLTDYTGDQFIVRREQLYATPLLLVLLLIESTDVTFAIDSIPAVLGITHDPFIAYTSNVFAVLGLRSLYFAVAGVMDLFHYLPYGLSLVLIFIGAKMLVSGYYTIAAEVTLGTVVLLLSGSIVLSVLRPPRNKRARASEETEDGPGTPL